MVVPCVGVVVFDRSGRLLVVLRAHEPSAGLWSLPGGRVEAGESLEDAARREVLEETGLTVDLGPVVGAVELSGPDGSTYAVTDFVATVVGHDPTPVAGDDAADARWVSRDEFLALRSSPSLAVTLDSWAVWAER